MCDHCCDLCIPNTGAGRLRWLSRPPPPRDTTWELASLSGTDLLPGTTITVEFAADEISGTAGCNHYGGSYQVSGDSLSVGDLFATEMPCPEPAGVLDQESDFLAALRTADAFRYAEQGHKKAIVVITVNPMETA